MNDGSNIEDKKNDEYHEFISSRGNLIRVPHDPSRQACEQFVRVLLDIKAKYDIK